MRRALAVLAAIATAACDPMQTRGLAVSPDPAARPARAEQEAFAIAEGVARRFGLRPGPDAPALGEQGWRCHRDDRTYVCVAAMDGAVRVYLADAGFMLSDEARAVLDALPAELRGWAVRECTWVSLPQPAAGESSLRCVEAPGPR